MRDDGNEWASWNGMGMEVALDRHELLHVDDRLAFFLRLLDRRDSAELQVQDGMVL